MTKPLRQAGNLLFLAFLAIGFAQASYAETPDRGGAAGAGGDQTVAIDDLLSTIADTIDAVIPTKETIFGSKGESAAKEPQTPEEPKMIKAKRLDQDQPAAGATAVQGKGAAAGPTPPYKVYSSPTLLEDRPAYQDPYESARAQMAPARAPAYAGWGGHQQAPAQPLDSSQPPPLPQYVKQGLSGQQPVPAAAAPTALPTIAPRQAYQAGEVPPISALPKQFFPILPAGALPDTPPQLLPVASNFELEADHSTITRAIIVIHDIKRNSAEGVATLMTLGGASGEETLILAPQFPLATDIERFAQYLPDAGRNIARWPVQMGWQLGGESTLPTSRKGISSFMATDLLIMFLADRNRFPMMQQIIVTGHGMGADFVQRYAAIGQAPDVVEKDYMTVRFLIANPSSFLYLTGLRPSSSGPSFTPFDPAVCPTFNTYPYGLNKLVAYARRIGQSAIKLRYPERKMTYLVGDRFIADNYLDQSCAALAQGADRLARTQNYARYLTHTYGANVGHEQIFALVKNAGYDPVALYGSPCGMETLFGSGSCAPSAP